MKLIMFSGIPDTSKSTLSEETGRILNTPVFALDWMIGTLVQFSVPHQNILATAEALLTMLAQRQLGLEQSAIVDSPAHTVLGRKHWQELARSHGAVFYRIKTICSDITLHRQRVERRKRRIPGRPEIDWSHTERMRAAYEAWQPWESDSLTLDAVNPIGTNIQAMVEYVQS